MRSRLLPLAAALVLIGLGAWQLGGAGWIHAKAWLAQGLMEASWAGRLAGAQVGAGPVRPWPWADTWPVARLEAPGLGITRIVLAGASGRTLAFGPGHMDGTAAPGAAGHAILSGHRDTHFRFLKDLAPGDALRVQRPDGGWRDYRVTGAEVIDARHARLAPDDGRPVLSLVTCYPFDAVVPGGPLRYVVTAEGEAPLTLPLTRAPPSPPVAPRRGEGKFSTIPPSPPPGALRGERAGVRGLRVPNNRACCRAPIG